MMGIKKFWHQNRAQEIYPTAKCLPNKNKQLVTRKTKQNAKDEEKNAH